MIDQQPQCLPELDPGFIPAKIWNDGYRALMERNSGTRKVLIRVGRPDGRAWVHSVCLLPDTDLYEAINLRYFERNLKFLLWAWGGNEISIEGAPELVALLKRLYAPRSYRHFDSEFMGETCFLAPFVIKNVDYIDPDEVEPPMAVVGRSLEGCRIGFDLGGSDRKCAALRDGEVVFSEEIKWDPYFQSDPYYHLEGIHDSLKRAAAHLPRVDAIGGSAAGVYVNNEPRVASLFRGISGGDFEQVIRPLFKRLKGMWSNVPFEIQNDGDVTALAGSMSLGQTGVLGISMGTSEAAGYIDSGGRITGWLNELAFAPVDYRIDAPEDEWSGDRGCGVQYFSQQAVGRLVQPAGIEVVPKLPLPEVLELVQARMKAGDDRAAAIYRTIGTYFGYSIAHYADFYDFRHLLFLGRVSSGQGGQIIQETAEQVLQKEFPELAKSITIGMPDETMKRHGQAVAAASLPILSSTLSL